MGCSGSKAVNVTAPPAKGVTNGSDLTATVKPTVRNDDLQPTEIQIKQKELVVEAPKQMDANVTETGERAATPKSEPTQEPIKARTPTPPPKEPTPTPPEPAKAPTPEPVKEPTPEPPKEPTPEPPKEPTPEPPKEPTPEPPKEPTPEPPKEPTPEPPKEPTADPVPVVSAETETSEQVKEEAVAEQEKAAEPESAPGLRDQS
ncbi:unnamed protein product [Clavelina lepadiformis]|uniref:Uncharacterized protein n=1 Tax=Clavelina lepadiformis TaxID=159417 RepID=A0ABP0GIN2_CLALP